MNKTILINPELLKIRSGTRKRRESTNSLKIKPCFKTQKENNTTLAKRQNILKFIRRHQEDNKNNTNTKNINSPILSDTDDFDESMKYLMDMTDVIHDPVCEISPTIKENTTLSEIPLTNLLPKYGCMKHGGTLPTYREYYGNQTRKKLDQNINEAIIPSLGHISNHTAATKPTLNKKILKRTFRIGKSLKDQKISVLISNKTLRKEITNTDTTLKQASMIDVRRYLVKHGLIKIGTSSPPDVLRQMYESASLMCGNVINHNSETLMYNFLNADEIHP